MKSNRKSTMAEHNAKQPKSNKTHNKSRTNEVALFFNTSSSSKNSDKISGQE